MKHIKALVIGMGRIGSGAYEELQNSFMQNEILSIEHDEKKVITKKNNKILDIRMFFTLNKVLLNFISNGIKDSSLI